MQVCLPLNLLKIPTETYGTSPFADCSQSVHVVVSKECQLNLFTTSLQIAPVGVLQCLLKVYKLLQALLAFAIEQCLLGICNRL